jgi:hypothetical protein
MNRPVPQSTEVPESVRQAFAERPHLTVPELSKASRMDPKTIRRHIDAKAQIGPAKPLHLIGNDDVTRAIAERRTHQVRAGRSGDGAQLWRPIGPRTVNRTVPLLIPRLMPMSHEAYQIPLGRARPRPGVGLHLCCREDAALPQDRPAGSNPAGVANFLCEKAEVLGASCASGTLAKMRTEADRRGVSGIFRDRKSRTKSRKTFPRKFHASRTRSSSTRDQNL